MRQILLACIGVILMFSCTERDVDKIGEAQDCVDQATSANADNCLSIVSGLTSERSYRIRCSVHYIKQGFDEPSKFTSVFEALTSSSNTNPLLAAAPVLAFSSITNSDGSQTDASTAATNAESDCKQGGSPGLTFVSGLSVVATTLATANEALNLNENSTPEEFAQAISSLESEDDATIGSTVISMNEAYCNGSGTSDDDVCSELSSAIGDDSSNTSCVGEKASCLMDYDQTTQLAPIPTSSDDKKLLCCRAILDMPSSDINDCNDASVGGTTCS